MQILVGRAGDTGILDSGGKQPPQEIIERRKAIHENPKPWERTRRRESPAKLVNVLSFQEYSKSLPAKNEVQKEQQIADVPCSVCNTDSSNNHV